MERLLQHRRNKALESLESSCNLPAPLFRMSAGVDYSGPLTMRLSDMSAYEGHCPRKSREPKAPRANSIRSNLQELEEKLNKARTLLETSNSQKHVLAAGKRDSANNLLGVHQLRLFTCNEEDESTLNLDSHAFFKMAPSNAKRAKDYYVRTLINSLAGSNPSAKKHLQDTMFAMRSVLSLPLPSIFELQHRKVHLERSPKNYAKKTLLLELQDTLLSWNLERQKEHDFQVVYGKDKGYIALRPYALSFMKKVAQHFEVIVFTRLEEGLARAIAEVIDPQGRYFEQMLTREHCLLLGQFLVKDLRMLDRSPRDTVIVDCQAAGYMANCDNGVPVLPFGGGEDRELVDLERFLLREVAASADVRDLNRKWFKLANYWHYDSDADLIQELYL